MIKGNFTKTAEEKGLFWVIEKTTYDVLASKGFHDTYALIGGGCSSHNDDTTAFGAKYSSVSEMISRYKQDYEEEERKTGGCRDLYYTFVRVLYSNATDDDMGDAAEEVTVKFLTDINKVNQSFYGITLSAESPETEVMLGNAFPFVIWDEMVEDHRSFDEIGDAALKAMAIDMPEQYYADIVAEYGYLLRFVPEDHRTERVCKEAVKNYGYAIKYVPDEFMTQEMCDIAYRNYWKNVRYIPDRFKTDEMRRFEDR